jgi:uncharacterized protein (DUF305 family)
VDEDEADQQLINQAVAWHRAAIDFAQQRKP